MRAPWIAIWVIAGACGASTDGGGPVDSNDLDAAIDPDAPLGACLARTSQPRDATWSFTVGGLIRSARVHVPASYLPTLRAPVVLDFHGYAMSGQLQEALTLMPGKSDTAGFISVHPNGTGALLGWNAGDCCGTAAATAVDDVAFVDALLAELDRRLCIDPKRIYATGFSNGGFLSHRLGCERAGVFAAIAPVSGVMGIDACTPSRSVPVLQIHGTADGIVPYRGNLTFESVDNTIADWVSRNGCGAEPVEIFNQGDARCVATRGCQGDAEVVLCTITGGGHTWPGGGPLPGGHQSRDLSATDAIWDFFVAHPLP